ncbi:bifunctional hydroxymethylpyrimidine kinase/phosphomethylpyrimidine kinase [candidate division KSB1 bacterium]|nr:bifunctional hydroxymethylpyrimidine kinase/phosphomethylpyrimidine kinase [candidate division KSB1 bacterium]
MYKAMTIAGSDSGGGAGIQADLKTFTAYGVFGTSAITALTAQNTIGVQGILPVDPEFVVKQMNSILDDIGTDALKTGMLANPEIVTAVAETISEYNLKNVIVDPVMIAKSGDALLSDNARMAVIEKLVPLATVVTPNVFEAEVMLNMKINTIADMKMAGKKLKDMGCEWVVIKGGHMESEHEAIDVVFNGAEYFLLSNKRYDTKNTHGTGCTFSSAIAAGLAKQYSPFKAIQQAKQFISQAIKESLPIGSGHGPTNHFVGTKTVW